MDEQRPPRAVPPVTLEDLHVAFTEFTRRRVQPPTAYYVTRDDRLLVRVRNSVASVRAQCWIRLQLPDGTVVPQLEELVPATDRSPSVAAFDLAEGYLLSVTAVVTGATPRRGQVWAEALLIRGQSGDVQTVQVLVADQVTTLGAVGWPGGRIQQSIEGPAFKRSAAGTDPAAGVEVSETVPTDTRWLLESVRVSLVTSVTVANRRVHLIVDDGANIVMDLAANDTQAASLTRNYNFVPDGFQRAAQDNEIYVPLPEVLVLSQGWRVRTLTTLLDAGDNFGAPRLALQEWPED